MLVSTEFTVPTASVVLRHNACPRIQVRRSNYTDGRFLEAIQICRLCLSLSWAARGYDKVTFCGAGYGFDAFGVGKSGWPLKGRTGRRPRIAACGITGKLDVEIGMAGRLSPRPQEGRIRSSLLALSDFEAGYSLDSLPVLCTRTIGIVTHVMQAGY